MCSLNSHSGKLWEECHHLGLCCCTDTCDSQSTVMRSEVSSVQDWQDWVGDVKWTAAELGLGSRQGFGVPFYPPVFQLERSTAFSGRALFLTGVLGQRLLCIFAWVSSLINL